MKTIDLQKTGTQYAYFITFTTYGNWLNFDDRESVDPRLNVCGMPRIKPNKSGFDKMKNKLKAVSP